MNLAQFDDLTCAVLREQCEIWPWEGRDDIAAMFIRRSEYQGVTTLLHDRLRSLPTWPSFVHEAARRHAVSRAVWELCHQQILGEVVAALGKRDIEPVLFKGTALAYDVYANPIWRTRGDTDMIVAPNDWGRASETLIASGFRRDMGMSGKLVSYQECYTKETEGGGQHTIDLHRRINNSELISHVFSYAELRAEARPLPALCKGALAAGPVHALLLACLHPATHKYDPYIVDQVAHYGGDRLIWHYDVHLLAQSFTPALWQAFFRLALLKGLSGTSLEGLNRAWECYRTRYPDIGSSRSAKPDEPIAAYLKAGRLRQGWIDFWAIPSLPDRLRFTREVVFPPEVYMRAKYAQSPDTLLIWLYARRAIGGVLKRLRRVHQAK